MNDSIPVHPIEALSSQDKCDVYFSRVVDLAVASGLLDPDPNTEVGHFAFSAHYIRGKELDRWLQSALRELEGTRPDLVSRRRQLQNEASWGAVDDFFGSSDDEKIRGLIVVGASYRVWPTGTSFTLTYPWDSAGNGKPVRFRPDLSDFLKRRILRILKKAGKLRGSNLFGE
jgi:hypothetical protein